MSGIVRFGVVVGFGYGYVRNDGVAVMGSPRGWCSAWTGLEPGNPGGQRPGDAAT